MATYRVPVLEDFSWQPPIKDKDLSEQPGAGIVKGDRYIVGAGASGHWTGQEKDIATSKQVDPTQASHWMFDTPVEGWQCWLDDEDAYYIFDGTNWGLSPSDGNAASIDSLETVASAAINSINSLETAISGDATDADASIDSLEIVASAAISSIDSLELIDSTNASVDVVQDASIDSLETVASGANSSIDSLESEISTDKSLDVASIDSLETVASAAISSIDSLEVVDSTNKSLCVASIASLETSKQDKGTYVSAYGAIEFTV